MVSVTTVVAVCLCFAGVAYGAGDSGQLFSELFKAVTNALAASGVSPGQTRQDPYGYQTESAGVTASVYSALQTITKNDDLECVPRLLCEAIAGGNPASTRDLNIDKYSLSKLISFLEPDSTRSSPMLSFGKAVVLGLSNRGDPYSCIINYPKCPKDQTRLLYYLNNHRGGFFRFFDMKLPHQNYQYGQSSYYTHYPSYNTGQSYKPSGYYDKAATRKRGKYSETYAKKYGYSRVSFPGRKMVFPPSRGETRIQTKVVGDEYDARPVRPVSMGSSSSSSNSSRLVFSTNQRYGKKLRESDLFPNGIQSSAKPVHFVTDRLPRKFYFPSNGNNDDIDSYKFGHGHLRINQFFPKN